MIKPYRLPCIVCKQDTTTYAKINTEREIYFFKANLVRKPICSDQCYRRYCLTPLLYDREPAQND